MKLTDKEFELINKKGQGGVNKLLPNNVLNNKHKNPFDKFGSFDITESSRKLESIPIDKKYYDSYIKYGVHPNQYTDEESLNRQRAENQSAVEQFSRFAKQLVVDEMVYGSIKGISDMVDAAYNLITNEGYNDYTNIVSGYFEKLQDDFREKNEIYQKDPNKEFAFDDFGWWMNGAVSIGSTLSLAIPARATTGVLGLIGKTASRATKGITKGLRTFNKYNDLEKKVSDAYSKVRPSKLLTGLDGVGPITGSQKLNHEFIKSGSRLLGESFLMRTAENYQEARGVWKEVHDQALYDWENMPSEQKERLERIRPDFKGISAEEYANIVASESAGQVMQNNYTLLALDAFQLASASSILKNITKNISSAKLKNFNRQEAANLLKSINSEKVINPTVLSNIKNNLKDIATPFYAELSEGFEEAFQGYQSERAKEKYYKLINPNYTERALNSYLSDPEIWNQAFWGWIGGIGFQSGMKLGRKTKTGILNLWDKYTKNDADKIPPRLTIEKLREQEIIERSQKFGKLIVDLKSLEEGINPYSEQTEKGYKDINRDIYSDLDPVSEKDIIKEALIRDAISDIAMSAVDVGNYGLLRDFIKDDNFKRYIKEAGPENLKIDEYVEKEFNNIAENYYTELQRVISSVDGGNERILEIIARENLRVKGIADILKDKANSMQIEIDKLIPIQDTNLQNEISKERIATIVSNLHSAIENYSKIDLNEKEYSPSKAESKQYNKRRINELRQLLDRYENLQEILNTTLNTEELKSLSDEDLITEVVKSFSNNNSKLSDDQRALIQEQESYKIESEIANSINRNNPADLQERYDVYSKILERSVENGIQIAYDNLLKRAIENINNPTVLYQLADPNSEMFFDLNKDRELLQIAFDGGYQWQKLIESELESRKKIDELVDKKVREIQTPEEVQIQETASNEVVPSTGGEEITENEKIEEPKLPNDFVPIEQPDDILEPTEEDKKIVEATIDEEAAKYNKNGLINVIRAITARLKYIDENITNDDLIERVTNKIRDLGLYFDEDILEDSLKEGISEGINYYEKTKNNPLFAITNTIGEILPNDIIDNYLKWYSESKGLKTDKNGKVYIDLNQLFYDMIKDPNLTYDDAKNIYINIKDYVKSEKSNIYKFTNIREAYKGTSKYNKWSIDKKAAEQYFDRLIRNRTKYSTTAEAMHVVPANDFLKKPLKEKQTILQKLKNGDELDPVMDNKQIIFMYNNSPLVRIATYNFNGTNNTYTSNQSYGFSYTLKLDDDGTNIKTNFDKLFNIIINEVDELSDIVTSYIVNFSNTTLLSSTYNAEPELKLSLAKDSNRTIDEIIDKVLNNNEISELIESGYIKFPKYITTNEQKTVYILDELRKLFNYNGIVSASNIAKKIAINQWKKRKYVNAQQTYSIQQSIERGNPIKIKIDNLDNGEAVLSLDANSISDPKLNFNYKNNPFVTISDGTIIVEGSNETYYTGIKNGRIGLLVRGEENPVVALPSKMSNVSINSPLYNDLKEELKNIIYKRLNNGSFEEFIDEMNGLYGGRNTTHNNLFFGFITSKASTTSGNIVYGLSDPKTGKYILVAYKYKNDGTLGTGFSFYENGGNKGIGFYKVNEELIDKIVNNLLKYTKFNATHIALRSNGEQTSSLGNDLYTRKENGKYIIKLNGKEHIYENFADYAIKNGIFETHQSVDDNGNYFVRNPEDIYIKVETGETPRKMRDTFGNKINVRKIFPQGKRSLPYTTKDTLLRLGIDEHIADSIITLNLAPTKIFYRGTDVPSNLSGAYASYNSDTDNINFYKSFIDYINKSKNKTNSAIRIFLHENIHRQFYKNGYRNNKEIIDEIIDIWNEFIENIKDSDDVIHKEIMKHINEWGYESIEEFSKKYPNDNSITLKQRYAEEIIAESFTQSAIFNSMNNIISKRGNNELTNAEPTLFQKIINSILKLLGLNTDNIKNNTILARQYNLFAEAINNPSKNIKEEESVTEKENIIKEEESEINDEEIEENYIENNDEEIEEEIKPIDNIEEYFDDLFAITDSIDLTASETNSISEFVDSFDPQIKPKIADFVNNGGINFRC